MTTHTIPTTPRHDKVGHFTSEAILLVEGSSAAGGPGGWFVGGWGTTGVGRTVFQGPMVHGPYAYIGGRPGVLSASMGTAATQAAADAAGLLFRVAAGDTLILAGVAYMLTLNRRYPELAQVDLDVGDLDSPVEAPAAPMPM